MKNPSGLCFQSAKVTKCQFFEILAIWQSENRVPLDFSRFWQFGTLKTESPWIFQDFGILAIRKQSPLGFFEILSIWQSENSVHLEFFKILGLVLWTDAMFVTLTKDQI